MQTAREQIEDLREFYSTAIPFLYDGAMVYLVAYVMWTSKAGKEHWLFKLSNKTIIKVDP